LLVALVGLVYGSPAAHAATASATLQGVNEVPPNASPATGTASITVTSSTTVSYTIAFSGLSSGATAAHIHIGAPGVSGPVVVPLVLGTAAGNTTGTAAGTATVSSALAAALASNPGGYYVNVHSATFPGGEIRGQLTAGCSGAAPAFIYPSNGQSNVDGSVPFSWCAVAGAQYYYLTVGKVGGGYDVVNSGNLPGSQTSFNTGALPPGYTLYARVWAYVNGGWITQDISFTTPPVQSQSAMFTSPTNGQTGVSDPTHLFTWTSSPQAQYYYLTVGTSGGGYDVVNSGNLPKTQTSLNATNLPAHTTLYARLWTYIPSLANWVTQDITFTTA
jgi:hypothetical protein